MKKSKPATWSARAIAGVRMSQTICDAVPPDFSNRFELFSIMRFPSPCEAADVLGSRARADSLRSASFVGRRGGQPRSFSCRAHYRRLPETTKTQSHWSQEHTRKITVADLGIGAYTQPDRAGQRAPKPLPPGNDQGQPCPRTPFTHSSGGATWFGSMSRIAAASV